MFQNVPECSGMFRNVPCSGFYRRHQLETFWFKMIVINEEGKKSNWPPWDFDN